MKGPKAPVKPCLSARQHAGKNAPQSVSYFTFGWRKICKPYLAKMGDENASHRSHRMDRRRRPGRAWPALVGCRDVQIGPPAQRGNQLARDAVRQSGTDNELVRNILLALLASLAKVEAQKISERTRAGMARARAQGKRIGRPALPHKLKQQIAQRVAGGDTAYRIAKDLGIDRHTAAKYA
jgi:resolvase-like protein